MYLIVAFDKYGRYLLGSITEEEVRKQGVYISKEDIEKVSFSVYLDLVTYVGVEINYSKDQLKSWAKVAKNGESASKMTPEVIQKLGKVCIGLSADDIGKLNFQDDETILSCSKQQGFDKEQVSYL